MLDVGCTSGMEHSPVIYRNAPPYQQHMGFELMCSRDLLVILPPSDPPSIAVVAEDLYPPPLPPPDITLFLH